MCVCAFTCNSCIHIHQKLESISPAGSVSGFSQVMAGAILEALASRRARFKEYIWVLALLSKPWICGGNVVLLC